MASSSAIRKEPLFISISGLLASGKTTLAKNLSTLMKIEEFNEPVIDNVYLEDFYKDMKKYSFALQVYLLNARFQQQQQIIWSGRSCIQDRSIYEDSIFAKMLYEGGLMEKRDYETYLSLFKNMSNFMRHPNIIVHLDVSPETSLERIRMRGRKCEEGISLEYLIALKKGYDDFLLEIAKVIPVIKIDYSEFHDAEKIAEAVLREYEQICEKNIHHVKIY